MALNKLRGSGFIFALGAGAWSRYLLVLRASPESQSGDQNGHDHDRFQKFQSISPPFLAGCSGLFRQGNKGKQCFSNFFKPITNWRPGFISSSRSFPRLWSLSPFRVEHKHQSLKQWPKRPRSESPLKCSIYFASFRCKLHCPCKITRTTTFLSSPLDVLPRSGFVELPKFQACATGVIPSEVEAATQLRSVGKAGLSIPWSSRPIVQWDPSTCFTLLRMTPDEAHTSITTGVSSSTNSNSSITSALRIRTQPWLAGVPILSSCLVP